MKKLILFVTIICLAFGTTMAFAQEVDRKQCVEDYRTEVKNINTNFSAAKEDCNEDALEMVQKCLDDKELTTKKAVRKCIKDAIKFKKECKKAAITAKKDSQKLAIELKKKCFSDTRTEKIAPTEKKKKKK